YELGGERASDPVSAASLHPGLHVGRFDHQRVQAVLTLLIALLGVDGEDLGDDVLARGAQQVTTLDRGDRGDQACGRPGVVLAAEHGRGPHEGVDVVVEVLAGQVGAGDDDRVCLHVPAVIGAVDGERVRLEHLVGVLIDVLDARVGDLTGQGCVHPVQGGGEGGVGDVLDVARVGGGEGEGDLFGVGEVAGGLDLVGIVAGRGRRIVARAAAVGGLGPAAVRGHHRGAGTVLPVVAGGEADNSPGRPGQQGEAEHGDDDDASNG